MGEEMPLPRGAPWGIPWGMQCPSTSIPRRVFGPVPSEGGASGAAVTSRDDPCHLGPWHGATPSADARGHPVQHRGPAKGRGVPGVIGTSQPVPELPQQPGGTSPQAHPCHRGPHDGPSAEPCRPGLQLPRVLQRRVTPRWPWGCPVGLTSPCSPGRAAGSREPAPAPEAGSI